MFCVSSADLTMSGCGEWRMLSPEWTDSCHLTVPYMSYQVGVGVTCDIVPGTLEAGGV